jgi:hypothetical protein
MPGNNASARGTKLARRTIITKRRRLALKRRTLHLVSCHLHSASEFVFSPYGFGQIILPP